MSTPTTTADHVRLVFRRPWLGAEHDECTACLGDGYLLGDGEAAEECECKAWRIATAMLERAQLPAATWAAVSRGPLEAPAALSVTDRALYRQAKANLHEAICTAEQLARGLPPKDGDPLTTTVVGVAGSGKTWMLSGAVWWAAMSGIGSLLLQVADPFTALSQLGGGRLDAGQACAARVPFLALDDVGGHRNPTGSSIVRDLLGERVAAARVTAVATRSSRDDLELEFGPSIADILDSRRVTLGHNSLRPR